MSDGPWHEDPTFRGTLEGLLFPPEKLDAADELDALLSLTDVGGGRVLDVPCGVGRHAVELADRGFEVTGVDATGQYLETARRRAEEAEYVVDAVVHGEETPVEYPGMAHAIFGSPQVAGLGDTEDDLEGEAGEDYRVGTCGYDDTALGETLDHEGGFAKVLVDPDGEVLGCHVVGPDASTLIHEVSTALAAGADAETIAETIHVHPALSEVVQAAFRDAVDVAPSGI